MKFEIKSRWTGSVLFSLETDSLKLCVKGAHLEGADLEGADLKGAYLKGAYLEGAYLKGADLEGAYLKGAHLEGAHLEGADLKGAYLKGAYLKGAYLEGAYLKGADLEGAYLKGAHLEGAHLEGAHLEGAHLEGAYLKGAYLKGAYLKTLLSQRTILPDGDLIGWKKLSEGEICKLKIPAAAKRVGGLVGRKCRAEYAEVLEGEGISNHSAGFKYTVGSTVKPDQYDPDPLVECSHGIHFYITKEEAKNHTF